MTLPKKPKTIKKLCYKQSKDNNFTVTTNKLGRKIIIRYNWKSCLFSCFVDVVVAKRNIFYLIVTIFPSMYRFLMIITANDTPFVFSDIQLKSSIFINSSFFHSAILSFLWHDRAFCVYGPREKKRDQIHWNNNFDAIVWTLATRSNNN